MELMRVGSWNSRTLQQMRWPRHIQPWRMRQRLTLRPVQRTRHHQRHQQRHWRLRVHVPLRKIMRTTVQSLTSTLPPPLLEPSVAPMYVLLDLRPLLLKFLMQLLLRRRTTGPLKLLLLSSKVRAKEILPLHLLGRPMPRGLSTSSTSMMVLLVRARTSDAPQPRRRFWTACRRCASRRPQKMRWLH